MRIHHLLACFLVACATPLSGGSFDAGGFKHAELPFFITYAEPSKGLLIDDDWQVESHRLSRGKPSSPKGGEHSAMDDIGLDYDGDGEADRTVSTAHHDLELSRKSKRGLIMVFTDVLSEADRNKQLSVLIREVVERAAGTRLELERTTQGVKISASEISSDLHDQTPVRVGGRDGYAALIDLREGHDDRDPLRMALVAVPAAAPVTMRSNLGPHSFAAIHVFTFVSDRQDFDDGLRAFERLLGRVNF